MKRAALMLLAGAWVVPTDGAIWVQQWGPTEMQACKQASPNYCLMEVPVRQGEQRWLVTPQNELGGGDLGGGAGVGAH